MKSYIALIQLDLKLALRQKSVLFFNYMFPLIFFVVFAQAMHGDRGNGMTQIVTMVIIIGVLGNGLVRGGHARGAGARVQRPSPLQGHSDYSRADSVAATVVGWILFMPLVLFMFCAAHFGYGMPWPARLGSILLFATLGILAFRAIGMILAAVANSMQESQILVQLVYLPMLFLSGATFPTSMFPSWLLIVTQFLPATYLVSGLEGMMLRQESLAANGFPALALLITVFVGLFISYKLFRWEKEEKIRGSAKLWVGAVMLPFIVLGVWQAHTQQNVAKTKMLNRQLARGETYLIRGARIFVGDGKIIESGAILIRNGKIAGVYEGEGPDPKTVKATPIEAAGKTALPGLIDVHVHLVAPGGFYPDMSQYQPEAPHAAQSGGLPLQRCDRGQKRGRPFGYCAQGALHREQRRKARELSSSPAGHCLPLKAATAPNISKTCRQTSGSRRKHSSRGFRLPPTKPADKSMSSSTPMSIASRPYSRLAAAPASSIVSTARSFQAIAQEAHAQRLPLAVHTGDVRDVTDAVSADANSIEHGSFREAIPDALFQQMVSKKIFYDPTLSVGEAFRDFAAGKTDLLKRSLVQQVGPTDLIEGTEKAMASKDIEPMRERIAQFPINLDIGTQNLLRAYKDGVTLVTGSDAGNLLVLHGPTVQHELALWVRAGIPPAVALQAATYNAARLLRAENHIGSIRVGNDADLLLVDGNPLEDITAVERISIVVFKGEQLDRSDLFNQE